MRRWLSIWFLLIGLNGAMAQPIPLPRSEQAPTAILQSNDEQRADESQGRPGEPNDTIEPKGWAGWASDPIVVFNGLLVLFTGGLFASTCLLWLSTRQAANAALSSADAFSRSVRPYLFLNIDDTKFFLQPDLRTNLKPTVQFSFANLGSTPAIAKEFRAAIEVMRDPPRADALAPLLALRSWAIGPKEYSAPYSRTANISPPEVQYFEGADTFLWFHGRAVYDDPSGQGHVTEFCWRYNRRTQVFGPYDEDRKRNNYT